MVNRTIHLGKTPLATPTTTWNPASKNAHATLSNGNLTATGDGTSNNYASMYAVASASSGKKYWEVTIDPTSIQFGIQTLMGVAEAGMSLADNFYLGIDAHAFGWIRGGDVYNNGGVITTIQIFSQLDVACMALDIGNKKIWFRTNGGNWNNDVIGNQNPATNTGGVNIASLTAPLFAVATVPPTLSMAIIANFGATAYAQTPPSGFVNW